MMVLRKIFHTVLLITIFVLITSSNVFARAADEIEVYKIGNQSVTIKWTPYDAGANTMDKYTIGYKIYGSANYTYIDVDGSLQSSDYNSSRNEFSKKISNLSTGTIYDIKIDAYIEEDPNPIAYYSDIKVLTKMIIDKTATSIINPYGNDNVGHLDFAFTAPNEEVLGASASIDVANIDGYKLLVSSSEGQIYSSGQPYKVLYNGVTGEYDIYKVTTLDEPLTYTGTQFSFPIQDQGGKDLLAFSLYKNNQPAASNFTLATVYYVTVQPIFKAGTAYEDVIVDATANYETIETIATLLPLSVTQISNDLIKLDFESSTVGSMTYDIYKGRTTDSLDKIHTEYDDGSRLDIQYFNKLDSPGEGDVYYFKVVASNGVTSKIIGVTISLNPNIAPVLENVQVERIITDKVNMYSDIIISWDKPDSEDTNRDDLIYRLYLNTDSQNQVYDNDVVYDGSGNILYDINGKIVLNTKVDINNNNILFNGLPVVFERIAEIDATNLSDPLIVYGGNNPIGNFLEYGNNYYRITRNNEQVIRTIYRINGQNFLSNMEAPLYNTEPHAVYTSMLEGEIPTDYKTSLDLNTTYFIKMNSYNNGIAQSSDYSLTTSFTTPTEVVDTIPTPINLEAASIETDSIGLIWDKIDEDLYDDADVTYEVYISENGSYSDINFYKIKNPNITLLDGQKYLIVDSYTLEDDIPKVIEPNHVYLFKVRAVWTTTDDMGNTVIVYSNLSSILPVTTKREILSDPDMTAPPAPVDFETTSITSKVVSFQWTKVDAFSTYRIVKTSTPIDPFESTEVTGDGVNEGFVLDGNAYTYSDPNLSANTLYYFSIRSEVTIETLDELGQPIETTLVSPWITIPVTTILVEAPTTLTLVSRSDTGHEVTISWVGKASLDYQVATKDESQANYISAATLEGDPDNAETKTFQLQIANLSSNTLYAIKVRAKDSLTGMYSKYTDPILVRTQFNQEDYNNEVENDEKTDLITDIGNDWINKSYEEIGDNSSITEVWVKPIKAKEMAQNSADTNYIVYLNGTDTKADKIVYIPLDLINTLNQMNKILEIRTGKGIFYIRPWTLNGNMLNEMLNNSSVESRMVKIEIKELGATTSTDYVPVGNYAASGLWNFTIKLVGYDMTEEELEQRMTEEINFIVDAQEDFIDTLTEEELRENIDENIKEGLESIIDDALTATTSITLTNTVRINYSYNIDPSGNSTRYVAKVKNSITSQEIEGQIISPGNLQFESSILGDFIILGKGGPNDIKGHWAEASIELLISKYGFAKELILGKFVPDRSATRKEAISFTIDVLNPTGSQFEGLTVEQKAQKIGLTVGFPVWDLSSSITKEELAYLMANAYGIMTGIDAQMLTSTTNTVIGDINSINKQYTKAVYLVLDNDIMSYTSSNLFYPTSKVTRAQVAQILVNLLECIEE